jgi:hypothetical protein
MGKQVDDGARWIDAREVPRERRLRVDSVVERPLSAT